jgi:uncharacterized phage protein gp47/JayE
MAFTVPALLDIWTGLRNSMRTYLTGTDAWIEPNNLSVAGRSFTLTVGSVYERILYLYKQLFASTADSYHLEFRHAFEYGIPREQPSPAQGLVSFVIPNPPFNVVPIGETVVRPDGIRFTTTVAVTPDANGNCTVNVQATTPGAVTNTLPLTPLTFVPDPGYPNLPTLVTVGTGGLGDGADIETDPHLRERVLLRKQFPPHGGAASDYEEWALGVQGDTRVFVCPFINTDAAQVGTPVTIYPILDNTRVNGIPTATDLLIIGGVMAQQQPVTARVYLAAATPVPVNIQIGALQVDTPTLRSSIAQNLASMFLELVPVVTVQNGFTLPVEWINEAIGRSSGYVRHLLLLPNVDPIVFPVGSLPVLGKVNYGSNF